MVQYLKAKPAQNSVHKASPPNNGSKPMERVTYDLAYVTGDLSAPARERDKA